jgi:hypothetical protein
VQGLDVYEEILAPGSDLSLEDHRVSWASTLAGSCVALGDAAGEESALRRVLRYAEGVATGPRSDARWRSRFAGTSAEVAKRVLRRDPSATDEARSLHTRAIEVLRPDAAAESPPGRLAALLRDLEAARDALPTGGR